MKNIVRDRGQNSRNLAFISSHLGDTINPEEQRRAAKRLDGPAVPETREILGERMFRKVLLWERRRAERYQKSFLLMLVDVRKAVQTDGCERVLMTAQEAVLRSTRETDMVGWYQEEAVLGVLFTEISQADRNSLEKLMRVGILESLSTKLGAARANQIRMSFHFFPEVWDEPTRDGPDATLYPDLLNQDDGKSLSRVLKRAIDIVGSILAIVVLSPIFVIISIAIKLTSKGPVFFRQERVGQYGRRFTFLKFRSMHCVNDSRIHQEYVKRFIAGQNDSRANGRDKSSIFKITDDPRVTRIGRFLRKTSLDELPQFFNALRGEMSLVGPRPPIPYELESYKPWHRRRVLDVKPGITGLWQVYGRSRTTFDEMVRLDLRYAGTWSPWLDIRILLQTPRAILFGGGAF